jgi:DNA-binding GntR family transcriptional regulator
MSPLQQSMLREAYARQKLWVERGDAVQYVQENADFHELFCRVRAQQDAPGGGAVGINATRTRY